MASHAKRYTLLQVQSLEKMQVKILIVEGGCYGLKTSAARFHERVSEELRSMGFRPSKADFDLWMRPKGDHYEYVATYVDDIMVFSRDCMAIIERIRKVFDLKGVGVPEYYLGGNFHTINEVPNTLEVDNDLFQLDITCTCYRTE